MKLLQEELLAEAQQRMQTAEGKNDLQEGDFIAIADVIIVSVIGGPWATMDEFGTGSLMDTSNPALADYKSSNMWNPERFDNTIRSRSRKQNGTGLTDIFGEPINTRSNIGGIDLEQKGGKYSPIPPSHALQTAARWMESARVREKIKETIRTFPFGKFIITDTK
jgi:hypothetical protein